MIKSARKSRVSAITISALLVLTLPAVAADEKSSQQDSVNGQDQKLDSMVAQNEKPQKSELSGNSDLSGTAFGNAPASGRKRNPISRTGGRGRGHKNYPGHGYQHGRVMCGRSSRYRNCRNSVVMPGII